MEASPKDIILDVVDLSPENLLNATSRSMVIQQLLDCFSNVGFCQIKGIEGYDSAKLLKWTKFFFYDIPEEDKIKQCGTRAFNPNNSNSYRGYFPVQPGQLSCKRGLDLGHLLEIPAHLKGIPLVERTPFLKIETREKELDEFYEVMYDHRHLMHQTADLIMSLLAEAGGEDPSYFETMFSDCPLHTFRPLQYPKRVENIPRGAYLPDGRILSTPAHMDSGFLTLLQTFHYPGLEIQVDGIWYAVPPPKTPNTIVVNLGEQMTEMSNGRFKATIHRVIDIGEDRFSIPFFYEPGCDTNINVKMPKRLLPPGTESSYPTEKEPLPFAAFLLNKLPIYAEYSSICDHLPDWVRKKYLGHKSITGCWATQSGIEIDGSKLEI
ncbi:hypothetical protein TCAL_05942 [Tigriopus californicus]|uniref:Fe2OG dioxygenase domain-containing protein n=1 Tax=Tigriopus californicus TaxID=6832 RepID=A0A553NYZ4_TIGCA|nr:uncharacterized protein LOC131886529 isoform X2 [Tigriopus californicus]TRY70644.1 hypothetical protein TCAL_05942 [Tigriopus californicus]|eukprot:TCALIF_05942-PA protein Name:"Similar to ACO4 1-aminocyclopropane-1-carboxylate oxidase 4 (Arabidopsis thaliana)" AED:0.00 eAED:0.00 QI:174/1/1/1/1/1/5/148/378